MLDAIGQQEEAAEDVSVAFGHRVAAVAHRARPDGAVALLHGQHFVHVLVVRAAARVVGARREREREREDAVVDVHVSARMARVVLEDRHRVRAQHRRVRDHFREERGHRREDGRAQPLVEPFERVRQRLDPVAAERYLPLGNSWSYTPSSRRQRDHLLRSSGAMSGSLVTLIRSSGNSKSDAKSSGASGPSEYERTVDVERAVAGAAVEVAARELAIGLGSCSLRSSAAEKSARARRAARRGPPAPPARMTSQRSRRRRLAFARLDRRGARASEPAGQFQWLQRRQLQPDAPHGSTPRCHSCSLRRCWSSKAASIDNFGRSARF